VALLAPGSSWLRAPVYCSALCTPAACACACAGDRVDYIVALLPQRGVGQQVNGTRLSTRGRATRRGGCPVYTHATHCAPHEAVLMSNALNRTTKYPTGTWSRLLPADCWKLGVWCLAMAPFGLWSVGHQMDQPSTRRGWLDTWCYLPVHGRTWQDMCSRRACLLNSDYRLPEPAMRAIGANTPPCRWQPEESAVAKQPSMPRRAGCANPEAIPGGGGPCVLVPAGLVPGAPGAHFRRQAGGCFAHRGGRGERPSSSKSCKAHTPCIWYMA
jgi:hypothetical protein